MQRWPQCRWNRTLARERVDAGRRGAGSLRGSDWQAAPGDGRRRVREAAGLGLGRGASAAAAVVCGSGCDERGVGRTCSELSPARGGPRQAVIMAFAAGVAMLGILGAAAAGLFPADVRRVQAAAEGEVHHRGDQRDEGDGRTHALSRTAGIIGPRGTNTQARSGVQGPALVRSAFWCRPSLPRGPSVRQGPPHFRQRAEYLLRLGAYEAGRIRRFCNDFPRDSARLGMGQATGVSLITVDMRIFSGQERRVFWQPDVGFKKQIRRAGGSPAPPRAAQSGRRSSRSRDGSDRPRPAIPSLTGYSFRPDRQGVSGSALK